MNKLPWVVFFLVWSTLLAQTPTGTIAGQLLTREGQPAGGVRVSAMAVPEPGAPVNASTALVSLTLTDSSGRFRLENVPPGRYYVMAGFVDAPTYFPGVAALDSARAIQVTSAVPVADINFPMIVGSGVTVSGRVVRPAEVAPVVQTLRLIGGGYPGLGLQTTERPDGTFEFTKVRPGTYQLVPGSGTVAPPFTIVVGDRDIVGLELQVVRTAEVSGTMVVENNAARPRINLTLMPFKGGIFPPAISLQVNGTFRAIVPEGDYRVGWSGLPAGYEVRSITSGSTDLLAAPLKVVAGSNSIVLTLGTGGKSPTVKVSGRVSGLTGVPTTTPFRLAVAGSVLLEQPEIAINPDGSFESALLPGTYTLRFNPPLPIPAVSLVVPSRDLADVAIAVPPLKEIRGLISMNGTNAAIAMRLLISWNDSAVNGATMPVSATAASQSDGRFSLLMPEGERRLTLNVAGHSVQALTYGSTDLLREPLKLARSDTSELRVTVVPLATGAPAIGVVGGVAGGVAGGVLGGVLGGIIAPPNVGVGAAPPPSPPPQRIGGDVAQANLISSVPPVYPPLARAAQVQGVVLLQVTIGRDGAVQDIRVISGHPLLNEAAIEAVRQWRYRPQMLNGQPIDVLTTITVNFTMR